MTSKAHWFCMYAAGLICSTGVLGFQTFKLALFIYNSCVHTLKSGEPLKSLFPGFNPQRSNWSDLNVSNGGSRNPKLTLKVNGLWIKIKLNILPVKCKANTLS